MKKTLTFAVQNFVLKKYHEMFENIIQQYQVNQIEIDVLAFLANNPEYKYAQDIVSVRRISKGHVSMAIDSLTKKEFLRRTPDPNNRICNILVITDKAKELVKDIQAIQLTYIKNAYQDFSEEEMKKYKEFEERIYRNLGGRINE